MAKRRKSVDIPVADFVEIIHDGAMAGPVLEGFMAPVLVLDAQARPEIEEMIRVHGLLPPGDVVVQWGGLKGQPDVVLLQLQFERPIATTVSLRFSIEHQAILVEAALTARALYIQAGKPGDRLITTMDSPRMLIEIATSSFRPIWDEKFLRRMTEVVAQRKALDRREAEAIAKDVIRELKKLTAFRMPVDRS